MKGSECAPSQGLEGSFLLPSKMPALPPFSVGIPISINSALMGSEWGAFPLYLNRCPPHGTTRWRWMPIVWHTQVGATGLTPPRRQEDPQSVPRRSRPLLCPHTQEESLLSLCRASSPPPSPSQTKSQRSPATAWLIVRLAHSLASQGKTGCECVPEYRCECLWGFSQTQENMS